MEKKKKKFKLVDAILATVCITLVAEATAPVAAIGNSQYFWWIFLIIAFCIPYGLITAELGSTFPSEGGMYVWVKKAFGARWASRLAWNYWINFPLWIAALAVAVTDILAGIFGWEISFIMLIVLQLGYTWLVTFLSGSRISENKILVNLGTYFKVAFMVGLGLLGIYAWIKTGQSANPIQSAADLLPTTDLVTLSFLSVIIFNFLGLEVVATFAEDMENPKKDIPKAVIFGALLVAVFYLLPATGMNIALPVDQAAEIGGVTDAFSALLLQVGVSADLTRGIVIGVGLMFIYTLVANIASWSFGVHSVAKFSADDGGLPAIFKKTNKAGVATGSAMVCGVVATIIVIAGLIIGEVSDAGANLFWTFFSLSLVTLLISYILLFFAFIKLRKIDKTKRVYKVPGNKFAVALIVYVPLTLLILSLVFTLFIDFTKESIIANLPLIIGTLVSLIIQECLVLRIKDEGKK